MQRHHLLDVLVLVRRLTKETDEGMQFRLPVNLPHKR